MSCQILEILNSLKKRTWNPRIKNVLWHLIIKHIHYFAGINGKMSMYRLIVSDVKTRNVNVALGKKHKTEQVIQFGLKG